jgi:hypothetical protein
MLRRLGFFALIVFAGLAGAQAPRRQLSAAQAQQLEAALQSNPNDRAARSALLDYYFINSRLDPAEAIPARRRHILWLIENTPGDRLAGSPAATIDAAGHRLADPQGFRLASSQEPANKEIGARLGDEYALAIMGVTMVNQNGFPLGADPSQTQSVLAKQAREALNTLRNPYVLAKAGYMLSFQGAILRGAGKLAFDTAPLAESTLQRAVSLAPGDPDVANYLEQHHAIQREIQAATGARRTR